MSPGDWRDWRRVPRHNGDHCGGLSNYEGAEAPRLGRLRQEEHSEMRVEGKLSRPKWRRSVKEPVREAGRMDIPDPLRNTAILRLHPVG